MIHQILAAVGAALILGAYFSFQRGWLERHHRLFHALNLVGAVLLTIVAVEDRRVGFIVLEGAWALLSLPGVLNPPKPGATATPKAAE